MVEFALVLPMLLVLLLGITDFGRVFAAGITIEAAARDSAEIIAQEYLRSPPGGDMSQPAPTPGNDAYYQTLHRLGAVTACREARLLANTTFSSSGCVPVAAVARSIGCPASLTTCADPVIVICVHDNVDPYCNQTTYGTPIPAECTGMQTAATNAMEGGSEPSRYVEVRLCYRFTTLFNISDLKLPFNWNLTLGDVYLQKTRVFTIGYYPPPPTPTPPPPPPQPTPGPLPSETPTPTPTATLTPAPTPTGAPTPTPTPTPTETVTPTPTPEPTQTPAEQP